VFNYGSFSPYLPRFVYVSLAVAENGALFFRPKITTKATFAHSSRIQQRSICFSPKIHAHVIRDCANFLWTLAYLPQNGNSLNWGGVFIKNLHMLHVHSAGRPLRGARFRATSSCAINAGFTNVRLRTIDSIYTNDLTLWILYSKAVLTLSQGYHAIDILHKICKKVYTIPLNHQYGKYSRVFDWLSRV